MTITIDQQMKFINDWIELRYLLPPDRSAEKSQEAEMTITIDQQIEFFKALMTESMQQLSVAAHDPAVLKYHNVCAAILATLERARELQKLQPLSQWSDDDGDVLWWKLPINEPPYVGSPLSSDWPGQHTHWSRIIVPEATQ